MALDAGVMAVTVEFAKDLKDRDWFGKQDPYVIVRCGGQQFRSRTAVDGGKNPVWNETFQFNVINENNIDIQIKDEDTMSKDDVIGVAMITLAKCREQGTDHLQVPVVSEKSKKQRGFVSVNLKWTSNNSVKQHQPMMQQAPMQMQYAMPGGYPQPVMAPYPMMMPQQPMMYPGYQQPMMYPGGAPQQMYAAAPPAASTPAAVPPQH